MLNVYAFLQPFILALAYIYGQDNSNLRITFYIITFRAKYLPYCMLAMTFVTDSPEAALQQATGLFAAHLYDFLTRLWPTYGGGSNMIRTPQIVRGLFTKPVGAGTQRAFGTAFQGRPVGGQAPAGRTGGWTSGFNTGTWGGRGGGRRLGGD